MSANGYLTRAELAPITRAANGEQAYLRKDAAAAFMAMNALSERKHDVTLRVSSARVAYRPYADQLYFWLLYLSGRGELAAKPGTSNHGLGLAVDLRTPEMRQIVDEIGEQFGWAKKWSDAPSEWWHLSYRPGVWDGHGRVHHHPTLHPGVKSDSVVTLRRKMKHHGYKGAWRAFPKSRSYNRSLVSAVKRYQKNHHLTPNGVVGPKTWRKLG